MQMTDDQLNLIKEQFRTLKDRSPFYAKKFEGIDITDVQSQADFEKLPFSEKADLRAAWLSDSSNASPFACARSAICYHATRKPLTRK